MSASAYVKVWWCYTLSSPESTSVYRKAGNRGDDLYMYLYTWLLVEDTFLLYAIDAWHFPSLLPNLRGLVVRIGMEKTCLDNVLHLHVVLAQIHFLSAKATDCSGCRQSKTSGLCSGGYFLVWTSVRVRGQGLRA